MNTIIATPTCDIDGCDTEIPGLEDGYRLSRGLVCGDCMAYRRRHIHWPDESPEACVECDLDDGAIRHDCDESFADAVIVQPGEPCPCCGEVIGG